MRDDSPSDNQFAELDEGTFARFSRSDDPGRDVELDITVWMENWITLSLW